MVLPHLRKLVFVGEQDAQNSTSCDQVLDSEGIEIGIVGRFVVVEHQVDDVGGGSNKDELEGSVPQASERVGPKKVCESDLSLLCACPS